METINNVIKKIKAILGFHGVSDSDVLKACNTAYSGLLNNTAYPNPPVPLPVFRQALDSFNALIVDAEDGGKKSISAKDKQRRAVIKMYEFLGHYVEAACNDDPATFATSGFTAKSHTRTAPQPLAPAKFGLDRPRPEQRTSRCEGRKPDRHHCLRRALRTRRYGRIPWSLDHGDVDQFTTACP